VNKRKGENFNRKEDGSKNAPKIFSYSFLGKICETLKIVLEKKNEKNFWKIFFCGII